LILQLILKFDVSYGGGCQNHYFDVIWDTVVLEIHPCKTALLISHRKDDNDFGCNKVEVETLEIDLERLFVDDNAEALNCTIDIFKMTNKTTDPDIVVSAPEK